MKYFDQNMCNSSEKEVEMVLLLPRTRVHISVFLLEILNLYLVRSFIHSSSISFFSCKNKSVSIIRYRCSRNIFRSLEEEAPNEGEASS